jgi:S1-C subfamily serine protease
MRINPLLLFMLLVSLWDTKSQNKTSSFNQEWLKAIVSIEISSNGKYSAIGTGFLVSTSQNHLALVTAKHVIIGDDGKVFPDIVFRLNEIKGKSIVYNADYPPKLKENNGWFLSKAYDVACRLISFSPTSEIKSIDTNNILQLKYLEPGANLLIVGFPLGLRSEEYSKPLVRQGIVSKIESNSIIIDSFVFPGNSGGPVLYVPPFKVGNGLTSAIINEEKIIGIVSSYIPYDDVAFSNQTKRPRIIFEENSGLCNVIPIEALVELFNSKEFLLVDKNLFQYR